MDARCRPSEKLQMVQVPIPDYENDDSARCTACDVKSRMATRRVVYELLGYFFMIYMLLMPFVFLLRFVLRLLIF